MQTELWYHCELAFGGVHYYIFRGLRHICYWVFVRSLQHCFSLRLYTFQEPNDVRPIKLTDRKHSSRIMDVYVIS